MNSSPDFDTAEMWHPLSAAQLSRWFMYQLSPESRGLHNIAFSATASGHLEANVIAGGLQTILFRHAMLRTCFRSKNGAPQQRTVPDARVTVSTIDASGMDEHRLRAHILEDCHRPFDLNDAPLVRASIYHRPSGQGASAESIILIVFDHIVIDGWSFWKVLDELGSEISGNAAENSADASANERTYYDYIAWQRQWLASPAGETQWRYWQQYLGAELPVLRLPIDHPRQAKLPRQSRTLACVVGPELTAQVHALARKQSCTAFSVLLAAYQILLHRHSGENTIVVGCAVPGRSKKDWFNVVGDFVNPLPLVARFDDELNVATFLRQVRDSVFRGLDHQDFPFAELVERLQLSRTSDLHPLYQTSFVFQKTRSANDLSVLLNAGSNAPAVQWGGLELMPSPVPKSNGARGLSDLSLEITEMDGQLHCEFWFERNLFEIASIERMSNHFISLLRGMIADAAQPIHQLPLLSGTERRQLLTDFNDTAVAYPADRLIHQLFEEQATRIPDAVAISYREQTLTYAELDRRANQLAHHLLSCGVQPDDRVAICLERSLDMVVSLLGILKAGAAYVPLDPAYPAERLAYMLADSAPAALITHSALQRILPAQNVPLIVLDRAVDAMAIVAQRTGNPDVPLMPHHLAYVIYTSGSTGQPKGVMIEHGGLCNLVTAQIELFEVDTESRVLQFASFSFDASISEIMMALCAGARLHLDSLETLRPGEALLHALRQHRISHVTLPSSALAVWRDALVLPPMTIVLAGEAFPPAVARAWAKRHRMFNAYGPTETTVCATAYRCNGNEADFVPIGRPIANTRIYVLDRHRQPVPLGATGEIYIGGAGVARGYLNRPELTAERFLPDPFSNDPTARMYKTGDLARYLPDGNIVYLGRNDFQVKIRGFRIELGEIEARLAGCEGVREATVMAREDQPGDKRLVAYVVAKPGATLSAAVLRTALNRTLAEYMVPSAFVMLDAFPLTPNGKLDRRALPAPDQAAVATRAYEAPQGDIETAIALLWQELLGLDRVGRHDHFFELGGHSLLAVTLIERLRQQGLNADVRAIFTAPVLLHLAELIAKGAGRDESCAVPANLIMADCTAITPALLPLVDLSQKEIDLVADSVPGGIANIEDIYPLSPLQEGILFHHLLEQETDAYVLRSFLSFDSRERLNGFLGALQLVIDRHDILRTGFRWQGLSQPVQVVYRKASLTVEEITLENDGEPLGRMQYRIAPRHVRLDLQRAPLIAARIAADPGSGQWLLVLLMHHITTDHLALEMIVNEIQAMLSGHAAGLPAPVPYRHFIAQLRRVPQAEHEAYFRRELGDIDEPTAPFGMLDVRGNGNDVEEYALELDAALSRRIRVQARRHGVAPAVLFHVAFARVLAQCAGCDDVVFGTVLLGRLQGTAGAERAMGLYMNTLPLRVSLGKRRISEVVHETYRRLHELLEHEHAPLSLAQRSSGVAPPLPLISALFNYRHSNTVAQHAETAWDGVRLINAEERTNYPLTFTVDELAQDFFMSAMCVPGISAKRMVSYVRTAVEGLVELDQDMAANSLPVLPAEERHQLLRDFNDTAAAYPGDRLIHQLFEEQVAKDPDAIALVFGEQTLTYADLNRRANRLAHYLINEKQVKPDTLVGLCMERSPEMVIGILGILKAGGAYVPLDPAYPAERLAYMIEDAGPALLLTQQALREAVDVPSPIATFCLDSQRSELDACPAVDPAPVATRSSLAYVVYTSGSTGRPKGVAVTHRNVVRLVRQTNYFNLEKGDRVLQFAPITFDASTFEIWAPLLNGASIVVAPPGRLSVEEIGEFIVQQRIHTLWLTAALFNQMVEHCLPSLLSTRHVLAGGEALSPAHVRQFMEASTRTVLTNGYGPTECTTFSCTYAIPSMPDSASSVPIGRPIANTQVYILDTDLNPVPLGAAGEIYIGGAGVARGYLNRPELTAERFLPDPFSNDPTARMYKTGDLARYLPDGNIVYLGRNDFQVKIRGFRIEPGEVENALLSHDAVRDAVVVARETIAGDKRLVAYVVAGPVPGMHDESDDAAAMRHAFIETLRRHVARSLPDYMTPAAVVLLESLPLTPNGKVDRKALPEPDLSQHQAEYVAPRNDIERTLCVIWQEVLGVSRVGITDNFFRLGGHSLSATRLVVRINQELNVALPLKDLFECEDVAATGKVVEENIALARNKNLGAKTERQMEVEW